MLNLVTCWFFRLIQSVVYSVGQSTNWSLFTWIIVYNYKDLGRIFTKFGTYICLWLPYICLLNFCLIEVCVSELKQFLCLCKKNKNKKNNKEKNWNFGLLYLRNGWCHLLQIWKVASHYRWALPQQIWCSSDKRSQIYECVRIATLFFLLICLLLFARAPGFLDRTTHYCVSWFVMVWTETSSLCTIVTY